LRGRGRADFRGFRLTDFGTAATRVVGGLRLWFFGASECRGFDLVSVGPGELLFLGKAAAVCPALLGVLTTTGTILAGERHAGVLVDRGRAGDPQGRCDVAGEDQSDDQTAAQMKIKLSKPSPSVHG